MLSHFGKRRSLLNQNRFRRIALFSFGLAVLIAFTAVLFRWPSSSALSYHPTDGNQDSKQSAFASDSGASFQTSDQRLIYPYSVIPGGVRRPEELRAASARDIVVHDHYAGFDFRKARVVRLRRSRLVYLSYRIGDQIYWTKKRISLHKGEQLITDGKITARTRCGNQVSSVPKKYGFSPEPSAAIFDKPIAGSSTQMPFPENFQSALQSRPNLTGWGPAPSAPGLGTTIASGSPSFGSGYPPIGSPRVPAYPCGKIGNGVCGTGPSGLTPNRPTTPVPEPGTGELICAEMLAAILAWRVFLRESA